MKEHPTYFQLGLATILVIVGIWTNKWLIGFVALLVLVAIPAVGSVLMESKPVRRLERRLRDEDAEQDEDQ